MKRRDGGKQAHLTSHTRRKRRCRRLRRMSRSGPTACRGAASGGGGRPAEGPCYPSEAQAAPPPPSLEAARRVARGHRRQPIQGGPGRRRPRLTRLRTNENTGPGQASAPVGRLSAVFSQSRPAASVRWVVPRPGGRRLLSGSRGKVPGRNVLCRRRK